MKTVRHKPARHFGAVDRLSSVVAHAQRRRGAAMVEGAIVVGVFLMILFGMLDLGLVVMHSNSLSEASRRLAREAMVHGDKADAASEKWGPNQMAGTAGDDSIAGGALRPVLVAINPEEVSYSIEWPDGSNEPDDRVRVTLSYQHEMMIPFLFGDGLMDLTSISTMRIAH